MDKKNLFNHILNLAKESPAKFGKSLLVVFDLDSTLFNVSPRSQKIIEIISSDPSLNDSYPESCHELSQVIIHELDWGIREAIERHHVKGPNEFFIKVRDLWVKHFFSNNFLTHDKIYQEAKNLINNLHSVGASIKYLTGRDKIRMEPGTTSVLKLHNLPYTDQPSHIIVKPDSSRPDAPFKLNELKKHLKDFSQVWLFDNEPVILNHISNHLPEVNLVYVDTVHSGKEKPSHLLTSISWEF